MKFAEELNMSVVKTLAGVVLIVALFWGMGDRLVPYKVHDSGIVLISGCTSGLGKDAAIKFAELGYTVLAGARNEAKAKILDGETSEFPNLIPIVLDVTNTEHIKNAVATVEKMDQPLVAIINNAAVLRHYYDGFNGNGFTKEESKWLFDVNYFAVVEMTQTFYPLLKKHQGRVVNIGSVAGFLTGSHLLDYHASKFALRAFTDVLRKDAYKDGIAAVYIAPGYVSSNMCIWEQCDGVTASDTSTPVMVEAVTSTRPLSHYFCASVIDMPVWAAVRFSSVMPTKTFDWILQTIWGI